VRRELRITNEKGLHARAAARFVKIAERFDATVEVMKDGTIVSGDSILGLMMLAAASGSTICVGATGPDAAAVLDALAALVENRFDED
jgi:phosphocarrier protein